MRRIHPTAIVGEGVVLGEDVVVGPYAILLEPCHLGKGARIGAHSSIGGPAGHRDAPRPVAWAGDTGGAGVLVGEDVVIGDHVVVEQGTSVATTLGDRCFVMPRAYLGHDVVVDRDVTIAPGAALAGHVRVGERANVGMGASVHQRTTIGPGAMIGLAAVVHRDVESFTTVLGNPARVVGVNARALAALGADDHLIEAWPLVLRAEAALPADAPAMLDEVLRRWRQQETSAG